jgi:gluconate 2-dehydrogenase alpha chain
MVGAKAQPSNLLIPIVRKQKSVTRRTGSTVRRILRDASAKNGKVRGVTYIDGAGEEVFQPADLVFLASWTFNNTRLLLLSGLGDPYDPAAGTGTLGRNLTHQVQTGARSFFEKPLNRFMGGGTAGVRISDFEGDVFDHRDLPFLRGGAISTSAGGAQPITAFGEVPSSIKKRWGSEWKKAAIEYYDRVASVGFAGEHIAYRTNFMDLDPVYKDRGSVGTSTWRCVGKRALRRWR